MAFAELRADNLLSLFPAAAGWVWTVAAGVVLRLLYVFYRQIASVKRRFFVKNVYSRPRSRIRTSTLASAYMRRQPLDSHALSVA